MHSNDGFAPNCAAKRNGGRRQTEGQKSGLGDWTLWTHATWCMFLTVIGRNGVLQQQDVGAVYVGCCSSAGNSEGFWA